MEGFKSDKRIMFILDGGKTLVSMLDPEGIFGEMKTRYFKIEIGEDSDNWGCQLELAGGGMLLLSGISKSDNMLMISRCLLITSLFEEDIPIQEATTLKSAFGDVSRLSEHVRSFLERLSPVYSRHVEKDTLMVCDRVFFNLCSDALFNGIDGGDKSEDYRILFDNLSLTYDNDQVRLCSKFMLDEGKIMISCLLNRFGISKKKVRIDWNFGMGYSTVSDCLLRRNDKVYPSVRLAFDLAENLDGMYTKQRKKKTGLGKPRGKKK